MSSSDLSLKGAADRALFLVWEAPRGAHRSEFLARQLGMDIRHVYVTTRKGRAIAVLKYAIQMLMTLALLMWHRYRLVFVQNPPIFAVLAVYLYCLLTGARHVIDSHTDALLAPFWKWSIPLHRFLSRRAIATIVTNDHLGQLVTSWGSNAFVLRDVPVVLPPGVKTELADDTFHVVIVGTYSYDEPIEQMVAVARRMPGVTFHLTGSTDISSQKGVPSSVPPNLRITGYLPDEEFYGLIEAAHVVVSLTTENHTFQSGASEALWLGRPIITSDWPLLRAYFDKGTIHVDNTAETICEAITLIRSELPAYEANIRALQEERLAEWRGKSRELVGLIRERLR